MASSDRGAKGSLAERDARCVWHPYTQHGLERELLGVRAARGSLLVLEDGREIIDAISSWWTCIHGHGHPRLIEAARAQGEELDHVLFAGCTHPRAVELAEHLVAVAPAGLTRVFYSDDGSTAVEVALKMVLQRWVHLGEPQRRVFVALEGAYHGDTFGAMAVGERDPFFTPFEPLLFEARRASVRAESVASALAELGPRAAGVIVEPLVQGAGGMHMHSPEFLHAVRELCDQHGVPLVADEVMTGFGRTGALFACERAGVAPDIACVAKGLTGGTFPLAATLCTDAIFEAFLAPDRRRTFFHGHSFTANPVGCAIALASLELCARERVPARFDALGARIEARLRAAGLEPRRTGGIVAYDLPLPAGDTGYLSGMVAGWRARAIELGVLLRPLGNVVYAMPPASTDDVQCDRIADAMIELARM